MTFDETYTDTSYIISNDNRSKIVLKDKKEPRQYLGNNVDKKRVIAYRVDGGIIKDGGKCDFVLCMRDTGILYFVELKGGDYSKALFQVRTTIDSLVIKPVIDTFEVHARVVLSKARIPNIRFPEKTKLDRLLKRLNGNLKKESQRMVEFL